MEKSEFTTLGISNLNPDYFRGMVVHCPKAGYIAGLLAKRAEKIGEKCRDLVRGVNSIPLIYSSPNGRTNILETNAVASETLVLVDKYVKATERLAEDLSMIHPGVCCHCKYLQHFNKDSVDCTYVVPEEKKEEEEMKKLQNNFTTIEQSKRLLELGVPAESANCCYPETHLGERVKTADYVHVLGDGERILGDKAIPCWSAGRLIEIYELCYIDRLESHTWYNHKGKGNSVIERVLWDFDDKKDKLDFSKLEE